MAPFELGAIQTWAGAGGELGELSRAEPIFKTTSRISKKDEVYL